MALSQFDVGALPPIRGGRIGVAIIVDDGLVLRGREATAAKPAATEPAATAKATAAAMAGEHIHQQVRANDTAGHACRRGQGGAKEAGAGTFETCRGCVFGGYCGAKAAG